MSLRALAASDNKSIVEDLDGFGWPITVTNPAGTAASMVGVSTDVGIAIDVETGVSVTGRSAEVSLRIDSLAAAGLGLPRAEPDAGGKPWLVAFNDTDGASYTFKVVEARPDRAIGIIVCALEAYRVDDS